MIKGSAILVIDLGNSSTKCRVLFGKDPKTKLYNYRQFELSNVFASIDANYVISSDYSPKTSVVIDIDTSKEDESALAGVVTGRYCAGKLQRREFPLVGIRPTAAQHKWDLLTTPLSLRYAFYRASKAILAMNGGTDLSELNITWKVVALLPPGDVDMGKDTLIHMIQSIKEVKCSFPAVTIPIKVDLCRVLPEGYCGYVGVVYREGMQYREECKYLMQETVLIYDIGAGTTDYLVIQDNQLLQYTKHTTTIGGNNVFQDVRQALRLDGHNISDRNIEKGILSGFIKDGSEKVSIANIINKARETAALKINNDFQGYVEGTDLKPEDVSFIIACGGGVVGENEDLEVHALSTKIVENFKRYNEKVALVTLPIHTVVKEDEEGNVTTVEEPINPRELNLLGASILAEAL